VTGRPGIGATLWTSWQTLIAGTFAGSALAAIYGGARMATHQAARATQMPFGPFILLGALAALLFLAHIGSHF
jgi:leader peptidase (prepilin peptidase)/N-methyltransferase